MRFLPFVIYIHIYTGAQSEIFQGRGGFVELVHSDKLFTKTHKKDSAGKHFGAFSPRYS